MKILLTGSKGFVGNRLKPLLSAHDVTGFDFCDRSKSTIADYQDALMTEINGKQFDVVIHAGALVESQSTELSILHWNTVCSEMLFHWFRDSKIIFMSSNMAVDPVNLYGWTKYLAERSLRLISQNHCILRPSAIFGEPFNRSSSLPIVDLIVTGQCKKLYQDYIRDFIHVSDVTKAIRKTIDSDLSGTYNLGTGVPFSAMDLDKAWGKGGVPIAKRPESVPEKLLAPHPRFPFDWIVLDPITYLAQQRLHYESDNTVCG